MEPIKIEITILKPRQQVWEYMHDPKHITKWNFAQDNWHCPKAENDFVVGGKMNVRMQAKDRSYGFDFIATYEEIIPFEKIVYRTESNRKVVILIEEIDPNTTKVIEIIEPEMKTSRQMQRDDWYAILNNFHKYVENHK